MMLSFALSEAIALFAFIEFHVDSFHVPNGRHYFILNILQVHILEARNLKPEDDDGTCDPICFVECFGQKKHTAVKRKANMAVFDDAFYFSKRDLQPYELQESVVKVSVFDADAFTRNDLIGSCAFDLQSIYYRKQHEIYRQWIVLTDNDNPLDSGPQGFLELSITVLGPGDKPPVHDLEAELQADLNKVRLYMSLSLLIHFFVFQLAAYRSVNFGLGLTFLSGYWSLLFVHSSPSRCQSFSLSFSSLSPPLFTRPLTRALRLNSSPPSPW